MSWWSLMEKSRQLSRRRDGDGASLDLNHVLAAKFQESAGECFGCNAKFGGEHPLGHGERDALRTAAVGVRAVLYEPIAQPRLYVLKGAVFQQADQTTDTVTQGAQ